MRAALGSRRFAARIRRRFERRASAPRPLALALVRMRPATRMHAPVAHGPSSATTVRIEPRIALTLVRPAAVRVEAEPTGPAPAPSAVAPLVLRTAVRERTERLVERIAGRGERVERLPGSHPPALERVAQSAWAVPPARARVALTVRKPSATTTPAVVPAPLETASPPAFAGAAASGETTVPAASVASAQSLGEGLDLQAVTDRVIAAIDRRVVAEAERTGSL